MTPFWRRGRPLHERLADEGGLALPVASGRDVEPWDKAGIHGVARPRRWDAVVTVEADIRRDAVHFVALEDGTLIVEEDVPDGAVTPLAHAVDTQLRAPYRAEATRKRERLWAVAASRIQVVRLDEEIAGESVELAVQPGERTVLIDGLPAAGSLHGLEALAAGMPSYVLRAERIDGDLWEAKVLPL